MWCYHRNLSCRTSGRIPAPQFTKKEIQDPGVFKISSPNKIQKRIENLESEQATTVREKQELQKKQRHWISSDRISQHCLMLQRYKFPYQEKSQLSNKKRYILSGPLPFHLIYFCTTLSYLRQEAVQAYLFLSKKKKSIWIWLHTPYDCNLHLFIEKRSSQGRRLTNLVLTGILSITTEDSEMWY